MKKFLFFLTLILLFCRLTYAQDLTDDPLAESYIIQVGGGNEIIALSDGTISIYKYFQGQAVYARDTLVQVLSYSPPDYVVFSDFSSDDFDNDGVEEIAEGWIDYTNKQIHYSLLKPDQYTLGIENEARWKKTIEATVSGPAIFSPGGWGVSSPVFVQSGNFDLDESKEFILAYWANQSGEGLVRILLFDVSDSLEVSLLGDIMDQEITIPPDVNLCEDQLYLFDIECADFNGDAIDEVLLAGRNGLDGGGWEMFANIYEYDTLATDLVLKSHLPLYTNTNALYDITNMNVATGHFISAEKENGVISFHRYIPSALWGDALTDTISHILVPFEADESLQNITAGDPVFQLQDTVSRHCWYNVASVLQSADVNGDDLDEIISTYSRTSLKTFKIYQGTGSLDLAVWADLSAIADESLGALTVGNVILDTAGTAPWMELVVRSQGLFSSLYEIQYDEAGTFTGLEFKDQMSYINCGDWDKTEPLLTAELDGDIRLGKPARYTITSILQPLVILNAPPIHFDVLGGESYDVSLSYNENEGQFISHYAKESSQSTEVTSEFTQDWGTSQTLKAGASYWGVSVSAHLTQKYGKQFSKYGGHSTTVTVSIAVDAREDDRIYATVMEYDLWEYPVYGNAELRGHVLVVRPQVTENRWFPSKSWSGYAYIPSHEVGNILSYREYPLLTDNPDVDEKIKGDYDNSFVLDANSSYDWSLQFEDFETNQASTSKSYSREWGVDVDVWGSGYSLSSSYSQNEIYTHKTDVASGLNLGVHLDGIDMGIGEVSYIVTPYTYWATNGALVVDYAVRPEIAPQGGTETWWQVNYGHLADPAFILPWRYDPEKGFTLEDEAKRQQTKDLVFLPADPKDGDIIRIQARVHNFSLIPTPGPMSVKFYIGDPDNGGVPIIGTKNEEQVLTESAIPARGSQSVEMLWQIPAGLPTYPRIYAVIDRDDALPEIHEDNNKSWAILQKSNSTAIPAEENISCNFTLRQNYPNPFNPSTMIEFQIPNSNFVNLEIYNLLGQKVVTLVHEKLGAGLHTAYWNAAGFASGVYLYRLQVGNYSETKKLILMR